MSLLMRVYVTIIRILYFILYPFLLYVSEDKRKSVPPPTDDLLRISATKLSGLIRQKKLSSEKVVQAYIRRIREVNHIINAVVQDRFEDALKEAKSVDDYLRTTSLTEHELQKIKPLLGVPITIKESCMVSGMSYAVGSLPRKGIKADTDGEAVARVRTSGAIPLLVSATPELCMGFDCSNHITGTTCNPYDVTRNTGASSGGEGALLGSGASLIGVGSDLAGSIRFPAMCCGVFGHKPSPKIVPLRGHMPLPTNKRHLDCLTIGPMTRYAEDLKLLLMVLSGKQAIDIRLQEKVDLSKLRVFYMEEAPKCYFNPPVQTEIKEAIKESVKFLENNCDTKTIQENNFASGFRDLFEIQTPLLTEVEGLPNLSKGKNQNLAIELVKSLFGQSELTFQYLAMAAMIESKSLLQDDKLSIINEDLKRKLTEELRDDGVLLYPTFPSSALKPREFHLKFTNIVYLMPVNMLGLPSTTIPCGRNSEGLPIGIQVIAAPNQDRLCLAVAEELEKCFGGWIPPNNRK